MSLLQAAELNIGELGAQIIQGRIFISKKENKIRGAMNQSELVLFKRHLSPKLFKRI